MNIYVICLKTSSTEEIAKELSSGFGCSNPSDDHIQDVGWDKAKVEKWFEEKDSSYADYYEIRKLIITGENLK